MIRQEVRKPAVAGQFYPADPARLRSAVEEYMDSSGVAPAPGRVVALVAPHAGYISSGPTAGHAYARVKGKTPSRVILMGSSHRYRIDGACVFGAGTFETPLGAFPVDEAFAEKIIGDGVSLSNEPHWNEHSLEVHLPFMHVAMGETPIVPVLFGGPPSAWHDDFGAKLATVVEEEDLVVASTDLSHYLSDDQAKEIDKATTDAVVAGDCKRFAEGIVDNEFSMCGGAAVAVAMAFARERSASERTLLDMRTSAAVAGDYNRVVGYAAITMERQESSC
jgi:MEMO1 family protein